MQFDEFCRVHGLIVDSIIHGRWVRVPTVDHPRKRNGAYKLLDGVGWVQNHASSPEVSTWRPETPTPAIDSRRIAEQEARHDQQMREGWDKACSRAVRMLESSTAAEHNYLHYKRLPGIRGLVLPDASLMVPMRHWSSNKLVGAQVIRWIPDDRKYEKKMLPGMRAKGAVFRLGSRTAARTWLVEGYATGLSVEAAVRLLRLPDSVLVCFSAGNLVHVAPLLSGDRVVFADNDESGAGERAAVLTGLPYCMSDKLGQDANDMHQSAGIFAVANLMVGRMAMT